MILLKRSYKRYAQIILHTYHTFTTLLGDLKLLKLPRLPPRRNLPEGFCAFSFRGKPTKQLHWRRIRLVVQALFRFKIDQNSTAAVHCY